MGGGHSIHLRSDGTLWTTGLGNNGRLGLGDSVTYRFLKQVGTDTDWAYATCGQNSTWALKTNGTLWCCGSNQYGDLALGDYVDHNVFTQVPGTWASVSAGSAHTLAIKPDGTLWGAGRNHYGQLGLGVFDATYPPPNNTFTQVGGLSNWVKVSCGVDHTLALDSNGYIYATGYNGSGGVSSYYGYMLGLGDSIDRNVLTLTGNGTNDWTDVKAGPSYSIAIKGNNQSAWGCGENLYGHLGVGSTLNGGEVAQLGVQVWTKLSVTPGFKFIAPGIVHMMYIAADNSLWGAGHNAYGELGFDPGGAHTDQYVGMRAQFVRSGTENNWLRLWEAGYFLSSIAIRAPAGGVIVDDPVPSRPSPIWTIPTT
jgi:alpha-tubulin suppressor-like RCC1 family protein